MSVPGANIKSNRSRIEPIRDMFSHLDSISRSLKIIAHNKETVVLPRTFEFHSSFLVELLNAIPPTDEVVVIVPDISASTFRDFYKLLSHGHTIRARNANLCDQDYVKDEDIIANVVDLGDLLNIKINPSTIVSETISRRHEVQSSDPDVTQVTQKDMMKTVGSGLSILNPNSKIISTFAKCSSPSVKVFNSSSKEATSFNSNENISSQLPNEHVNSSWICSQCGVRKDSRGNLVVHLRMKHRLLKCSFCDFFTTSFKNVEALQQHEKVHFKIK